MQNGSERGICGTTHLKAAKSMPQSMAKLEETGLEVVCCWHGLSLKALNMFRGEM